MKRSISAVIKGFKTSPSYIRCWSQLRENKEIEAKMWKISNEKYKFGSRSFEAFPLFTMCNFEPFYMNRGSPATLGR